MRQVIISRLQKQLTALLLGLMLVAGTVMGSIIYPLSAEAAPLTPEAKSYQIDGQDRSVSVSPEKVGDDVQNAGKGMMRSVKGFGETVKEKLNLDEPIPESTRLFGKQLRGEDVDVPEPKPSGKDDTYGVGD